MQEIWKTIKKYPDYEVSTSGRIKSHKKSQDKLLKSIKTTIGYPQVNLYINKTTFKCIHIHRLVASAFIPNPKQKPQVNHIDGNKLNNKLSNLEWVTPSEQMIHSYNILGNSGGHIGKFGATHPKSRAVIQKLPNK